MSVRLFRTTGERKESLSSSTLLYGGGRNAPLTLSQATPTNLQQLVDVVDHGHEAPYVRIGFFYRVLSLLLRLLRSQTQRNTRIRTQSNVIKITALKSTDNGICHPLNQV